MKHASTILIFLALQVFSSFANGDETPVDKELLARAALHDDKEHSKNCTAAFDHLRKSLKQGMTSTEAAKALGESKWLEHIHSYLIAAIGGYIPVDSHPQTPFAMHLYPNAYNYSNYVVYFSLSVPEDDESDFTIEDFLQGKVKNKHVKLHQFALCHPSKAPNEIGRIEVFPPPPKDSEQDAPSNGG